MAQQELRSFEANTNSPPRLDAAHHQVVEYLSLRNLVPLLPQQLHAGLVPSDGRGDTVRLIVHLPSWQQQEKFENGQP